MRKNIKKVIIAFLRKEACNSERSKENNRYICSTTGYVLYSYAMPIAKHIEGKIQIVEYERAPSATTRTHIAAIRSVFFNHKEKIEWVERIIV